MTSELVGRLAHARRVEGGIQVVVGVSGSGKSSLLRAGLTKAVQQDLVLGPGWTVCLFTPGAHPCDELAGQLAAFTGLPAGEVAAAIRAEPARAAELVASGHRVGSENEASDHLLLVVDQFEEVFTACTSEDDRHSFIAALCALSARHKPVSTQPGTVNAQPESEDTEPAQVVIGLRADFYAAVLRHPELLAAIRASQLTVGPMTSAELRRAIVEPARKAGLEVEEGLVDLLLKEVTPRAAAGRDGQDHAAGALPLLSYALYATWQHSQDRRLTTTDYRNTGGIDRAVATAADGVYEALDQRRRRLARQLFLGLVHVSANSVDSRRRLPLADLIEECGGPPEEAMEVLDRFVDQRLVTVEAERVQISHEALLVAWPRLRDWLQVDRAGLLTKRQVDEAAATWRHERRDPAALYRGTRLAVSLEWAATASRHAAPGPVAREFLDASLARERAEQDAARVRSRRLRQLVAGLSALLVVAVIAVAAAVSSQRTVRKQRDTTLAGKVANEAIALRPANPALSAQLSLAAYRLAPTAEARGALLSTSATPSAVRLTEHTAAVYAAEYSPDGRLLATVSIDRSVRLWQVSDRYRPHPLASLAGHGEGVTSARFSPDGRTLATAGDDRTTRLWDVSDPRDPVALGVMTGHASGIIDVAYSPDGRTVATASYDRTVRLWSVADPRRPAPVTTLTGYPAGVSALTYRPDGRTLVTTSFDTTVRMWNVADPTQPRRLPDLLGHSDRVLSAAFSSDGRLLATGSFDNTIRIWDMRDPTRPRPLSTLTGHVGGVVALSFAHAGRTLVSGGYDRSVALWDVRDPARVSAPVSLPGHSGTVYTVAFNPHDDIVVSGSGDNTVRLWDLRQPILAGHNGQVNAVAFTRDGRLLAAGSYLTTTVWDVGDPRRPRLLAPLAGHSDGVSGVAFQADRRVLATASLDGTARLWDLTHPERPGPLATIDPRSGNLFGVAFSPDGSILALVGEDGMVKLWEVRDARQPRPIATVAGHTNSVYAVAFSPDGHTLGTGSADHTTRLWDVHNPRQPAELTTIRDHTNSVHTVAFSPDGRTLATGSADHTTRLWDVHNPRQPAELATLNGHSDSVLALAFSPDGGVLSTAGADRTVRLWNVTRPRQAVWTATLNGHTDSVLTVAFGRNGHDLATGGNDATARLWETDVDRAADRVCASAMPALTSAEWKQYLPNLPYQPPCPSSRARHR